jgi:hypothetical protein
MIILFVILGKEPLFLAPLISLLWAISIRYGNANDLDPNSKIIRFLRKGRPPLPDDPFIRLDKAILQV